MAKKLTFKKRFLVVAVISAAGAAMLAVCNSAANPQVASAPSAPLKEVSTLVLSQQNIAQQRAFPGRVFAHRQAVVRPQVDGIITERMFEGGAKIEKGQQLYQIDDARYRAVLNSRAADLESAKADLQFASSRAERYKNLIKTNAVSKQNYEDVKANFTRAKAAVSVAQAAVDLAQVDLDYTKVYAPISGYISRSLVTEGTLVTANQAQELTVITQLDPVYVDLQQSGTGSDLVTMAELIANKKDISVNLQLDGQSGSIPYAHSGKLILTEVTVDESTGSTALRAIVPNPEGLLRPGMFVRAQVEMGNANAVLVPQRAATRLANGGLRVWVVNSSNQVEERLIDVDSAHDDSWIVKSGVTAGEQIIVEGYQKVAAGEEVRVTPWVKHRQDETQADARQSVALSTTANTER